MITNSPSTGSFPGVKRRRVLPIKDALIGGDHAQFVQSRTSDDLPIGGIAMKGFGKMVRFDGDLHGYR